MCALVPKFRDNPSSHCGDMAIFDLFSRWRPSAILELLCACLDTQEEYLVVNVIVQNLVRIVAVVSIICKFQYFAGWA